MRKKDRTIIGIAIIVIFGGLGIWSFIGSTNPYVSFAKARSMGTNAQVLGYVDQASSYYDENSGVFSFYITDDDNDSLLVQYNGFKPGNFEQAATVVCVGAFKDTAFVANNILVKCPSKYQGGKPGNGSGVGR